MNLTHSLRNTFILSRMSVQLGFVGASKHITNLDGGNEQIEKLIYCCSAINY